MRFRAQWLALASLLFAFAPPQAAEPDAAVAPPMGTASAPESVAEIETGAMQLSLDDAIQLALENNLDVEVQRFGPLISAEDQKIAWGSYDPELFAEFGYQSNKDPNSFGLNSVAASLEKITDGVGGFRGMLPLVGSTYDFRFTGSRRTTNSSIETLSPALRSSFSLSLTQPLLRDLWWNQPWTRVKTSALFHESSLEEFRRAVMDTVQQVEEAYWNLIATEEERNVQQKSLETAQALLEQSKTEYEVGVKSKVEVVESEAGVAQRQFDLIRSTNSFRAAQDRLVDLVLGSRFTADAALNVQLTDKPDEFIRYDIDPDQAAQLAFSLRPELAIAQQRIETQEFQLKFRKNQRLPRFDVRLGYGNRGLSGDQNENARCGFIPATAVVEVPPGSGNFVTTTPRQDCLDDPTINSRPSAGDFGDSLDNFLEHDAADQFSARALFSIAIPNTAPRAEVSKAELELRKLRTEKRREEQRIILEVRKAVRDIASTQEGIEAARRATAAATEQLRAERVRLEYGESTPFDVLLREEDLVEAQSREIGAFRGYRTSLTSLNRAQGTILRNRNIAIDAVRAVR